MKNGELTALQKIATLIIILTAIIAPWLYHDRQLIRLEDKIDVLTATINRVEQKIDNHIKGEKAVSMMSDKKDKENLR